MHECYRQRALIVPGFNIYRFLYSSQSNRVLATQAVRTGLLDKTPMIKTNIWVVFCGYVIYALISTPLFLMTSGGWMAIFFYLGFAGLYYISSSILLFLSAAVRTRRKRTKVKIKGRFLLRIIAFQVFVVLFNYDICGDSLCYEGFLPTLLEEINVPIFFTPPFVMVVFALLLYLCLLSLFLLDVA